MQEALTDHTGEDLVKLRDGYGIQQNEVAAELGVSRVTLSRWEKPTAECKPMRWLRYDGACRRILTAAAGEQQGEQVA